MCTRITGDADIVGQHAAVVPVGRIGTDEIGTSLSMAIARFMQEGKIYLAETVAPYLRKLVEDALTDTDVLFRNFRWTVRPNVGQYTVADRKMMARLPGQVCSPASSLPARAAELPPDAYAVGAVLIERWRDAASDEAFRFDALVDRHDERKRQLVDRCRQLVAGPNYRARSAAPHAMSCEPGVQDHVWATGDAFDAYLEGGWMDEDEHFGDAVPNVLMRVGSRPSDGLPVRAWLRNGLVRAGFVHTPHGQAHAFPLGVGLPDQAVFAGFAELGRVIRTAFLLEYLSSAQLREQITANTNKVEACHRFAKWLFFGVRAYYLRFTPTSRRSVSSTTTY